MTSAVSTGRVISAPAMPLLEGRGPGPTASVLPVVTDLSRGFTAEVADPLWLLGRQWQLGEHRGEDASSPVRVTYRARLTPVDPIGGQPHLDPTTMPAEAIVESEPGDSWTPGRRITAGRVVEAAAAAAGRPLPDDDELRLARLPAPHDLLDGTGYDGRALWARRSGLGLDEAWLADLRPPLEPGRARLRGRLHRRRRDAAAAPPRRR